MSADLVDGDINDREFSLCGFDTSTIAPTGVALKAARQAIIDDLRLTPRDLLHALTDHWTQLKRLEMPVDGECTLLAFARHALLEPPRRRLRSDLVDPRRAIASHA